MSLPESEAVARRPGQLTEEDKQKLQSQGVPFDCNDELAIIKERYKLDKSCKIVGVESKQSLSRDEVIQSIAHLLTTTQNDEGKKIQLYIQVQVQVSHNMYTCTQL